MAAGPVIESQIGGDAQLNFGPARGEVKAPLVLWEPYLKTNEGASKWFLRGGETPRLMPLPKWSGPTSWTDHD